MLTISTTYDVISHATYQPNHRCTFFQLLKILRDPSRANSDTCIYSAQVTMKRCAALRPLRLLIKFEGKKQTYFCWQQSSVEIGWKKTAFFFVASSNPQSSLIRSLVDGWEEYYERVPVETLIFSQFSDAWLYAVRSLRSSSFLFLYTLWYCRWCLDDWSIETSRDSTRVKTFDVSVEMSYSQSFLHDWSLIWCMLHTTWFISHEEVNFQRRCDSRAHNLLK